MYGIKYETNYHTMKHQIRILIAILLGLSLSADVFGQAQFNTRKNRLSDFTSKTTKVVLTGDSMFDEALQQSMSNNWSVTPFEFCSAAEFEKIKTDASYYFLLVVKDKASDENEKGIEMLTLVKGGPEASKGIGKMFEVVSFPLRPAGEPAGRELVVLPAIIEIMQHHAAGLTETEIKAYSKITASNKNFPKLWNKRIYLSEDDLSPQVDSKLRKSLDEDILIRPEDEVDGEFTNGTFNEAISYVVSPSEPVDGSWCYTMIIGTDTHELYFIKKHKISARKGAGFLASDVKALSRIRKADKNDNR